MQRNMASTKLALPVALLLWGLIAIGSIRSTDAKLCPMYCMQSKYMKCPSTGTKQVTAPCNCCEAPEKGCAIYLRNGQVMNCTSS